MPYYCSEMTLIQLVCFRNFLIFLFSVRYFIEGHVIAFACPAGVRLCHRAASFTYFGEVLRCPHKCIVTIAKVYIARNNIHVELIRFGKK